MTGRVGSAGRFRDDGRLIVSYPKSGRTWLRYALHKNGIEAQFSHAESGTGRRQIGKPFKGIPAALSSIPLVVLHRHPIDTAVSMYYQVTRRDLRKGSGRYYRKFLPLLLGGGLPPLDIDEFVLHPRHGIAKICAFNRAWLDHVALRPGCLVVTYEEMRADPAAGFQRLLDHFGETGITGATLAASSDFEKMKAVESERSQSAMLKPASTDDPLSVKVRKGKVHGYLDELKPDTVKKCREIAASFGFGDEV